MLSILSAIIAVSLQNPDTIDQFVAAGTHPVPVAGGFKFLEGPVWTADGRLIWSDILGDTIYELKGGKAVSFIRPSHRAIGNTTDPSGRIISCQQETRAVVRYEKDGKTTVLANKFDEKRLNSPDDVVVRSDGSVYFTDPSFGLKPQDKELAFDGVYKISPSGTIDLLSRDFNKPNGLAFSPDEKLLYVNDTARHQIWVFDVAPSGELSGGRLFAYLTGDMAGMANGMKVDEKGDVFCTGPGGIQIFSAAGRFLGIIYMQQVVSNFCFGDADRKTLYITTGQTLYKIRLKVAGPKR